MLQGAVAEKVDAPLGEIELHLLRGLLRHPARPQQGLLPAGILGASETFR